MGGTSLMIGILVIIIAAFGIYAAAKTWRK